MNRTDSCVMLFIQALTEIDELLKYLDRAENEMNTADVISIDPEALAVQLRDHKVGEGREAGDDDVDNSS